MTTNININVSISNYKMNFSYPVKKLEKFLNKIISNYNTYKIEQNKKWLEQEEKAKFELEIRVKNFQKEINFYIYEKIHLMDKFEGTLEDYIRLKGEEFEIINSNKPRQKITIEDHWLEINENSEYFLISKHLSSYVDKIKLLSRQYESLLNQGLCGFIYCSNFHMVAASYSIARKISIFEGMPIRKLNKS